MDYKRATSKLLDDVSNSFHHSRHLLIKKYRDIKEKLSDLIKTNYELGLYHLHANNLNDATFRFKIVLHFRPEHYEALYSLAKCLLAQGKQPEAQQKLNEALQIKPDFAEANYLLQIIRKQESADIIPISIIEQHYDKIAPEFDKKFSIKNGYRIPTQIAIDLAKILVTTKKYDILDLGCGTGKCGYSLVHKVHKKTMIGVDISNKMLEIAQHHSPHSVSLSFNKFIHSDYWVFLENTTKEFDVILACMSLHFSNNLAKILSKINKITRDSGILAFAVEKSNSITEIKLNLSYENFCYNERYVRTSVKQSKFDLISLEEVHLADGRAIFIVICRK